MEAKTIHALLNIALLQAITFLFVYIRHYVSLSAKPKKDLEENEIAISVISGFLVFFVIMSESTSLSTKYVFFVLAVAIHAGSSLMILNHRKARPAIYPKSSLIFHNGSFMKGAILQNKLTEKEILRSLSMKGVENLSEVDTIILEPDGELSVIFKKKVKSRA